MFPNITVPTLLVDRKKCLQNIERMAQKAAANRIPLRPHFKTHQSKVIGNWYRSFGVDRIAVSSLKMAAYFAEDGWQDITVAFPTNPREIELINSLAARIQLNLLVENHEVLDTLIAQLKSSANLYIKADIGYHRTGLSIQQFTIIDALIERIQNTTHLNFKGFLAHAGHSYQARSKAAIEEIHAHSKNAFIQFRDRYQSDFYDLQLSYGDTPTCSIVDDFSFATEIRPGNFVFYDLAQHHIGSCTMDQIAVAMACPVVAKHSLRQEIIVYGGGVHFSKDRIVLPDGTMHYGKVVSMEGKRWRIPDNPAYVKSLSQEHGIIKATKSLFEKTQIGDLLFVLPVHSCMAANASKVYYTFDGEWITMFSMNS